MSSRPLGSTGLRTSTVGFGCWQLGGRGWGKVSATELTSAVNRARDLGVNLFDTAPIYGFGRSEELLARALRGRMKDVVIVSKGGLVWDDRGNIRHDNRPESLHRQLEGTLRRLGREWVDVYLLHWPDPAVPVEGSIETLEALRREGSIRAWGLSNFVAPQVLALDRDDIVLQYPLNCLREYAADHRESARAGEELLGVSDRTGWGFLAVDVLARGILGGRYSSRTSFGKRDVRSRDRRHAGRAFRENLRRVARIADLARSLNVSPAALAIRAILDRPGVTSCIVGMKRPEQVEENVMAARISLSPGERKQLESS